ncbi:MAG: ABC transporter substrate-binding protein [Rhodobacteraceae bacterium]|nr:MAG: ABC transporter substrate-binding protein [Paracoccaceae bacterium]
MPRKPFSESNYALLRRQLAEGKLSRREFVRYAALIGVSAGVAAKTAGLPGRARAEDIPMGGTVRIAMGVQDISNPAQYDWPQKSNLARGVCEFLTKTGPDNITRPWLLEGWEASEDLRTWDLKVRPGVTWRNGRAFTAEDVEWNIRRLLAPETGSSVAGLMAGYMLNTDDDGRMTLWDANAIEIVDDLTVRLNLRQPQIAVPEHLYHYPFHILDPEENGVYGVGSNGTGPFELVEHSVGERAIKRKRTDDGYWGRPAFLDEVVFVDVGEEAMAYTAALASQQVDGIYEGDVGQLDTYRTLPFLKIYEALTGQTAVARVKVDQAPFDDPRVRKAMRLSVDTRRLLELGHFNLGAPGEHHHVAPMHPEYAELPFMERDVEAARALLAEAGHPNGIDAEIVTKRDPAWELQTVQAMAQQMAEAGIRVNINIVPTPQFWDNWDKVPFGFTSWGHRPLGVMALGLAYRSGVPWNESGFANARFDELLNQAEATLDVEERRAVMAEIQTLMQEEGPMVQPLWRSTFVAYHERVVGFELNPGLYIHADTFGVRA